MITIIDYGAGNLCSVRNALSAVGVEHEVVNTPKAVRQATEIVLPGVGHFGQMMNALDTLKLREPILDAVRDNVPYFGICLGMQALLEASEEAPGVAGLGLLRGIVRRFPMEARVPHMGWNKIEVTCSSDPTGDYYYFAHSYYVPFDRDVA
ncbi:MAG TPA: imidazole glycerol phosphate synthase subunit HisH, partial [Candidatus Solibacter sp.]|nr:imidazole glycerol phosphate synthase subunit HisH [Candidatus Solibacter sp.]